MRPKIEKRKKRPSMLPMIMKINFNAEQCRLNDNCLNVWVWHTICINEKLNQIRVIGESIGLFCLHKELGMIKLSWQTVPSDSRLTFSRKTSLFGRGFVMPNLDRTRSLSLNVRLSVPFSVSFFSICAGISSVKIHTF